VKRTAWDAESVLAASSAWVWIPDGAPHVQTEEYLVVRMPDDVAEHTSARIWGSDRDPAVLVDEVETIARTWGRERIWWPVYDFTRRAGLETERLRIATAAGATLALTKGAVDTSGPILTRAGFVRYGEERVLALHVP